MWYFWSQISSFLVSQKILHFDKFNCAKFKYKNIFKIAAQKYTKSGICNPKFKFFCLQQTLPLDKFEGADFKYKNIFFKMLSEKGISGPKFKNLHFFLYETLKLEKLKKADLKYGNRLFSNSSLDVVNSLSASVALI